MLNGQVADANIDWTDMSIYPLYLEMDCYSKNNADMVRRRVVVGCPAKPKHVFIDIGEVPVFNLEDNKSTGFDPVIIETRRNARILEKWEIMEMKLEYNL